MKIITFLPFLLVACLVSAQSKKPEYLLDENGVRITEGVFKSKIATQKFTYSLFENDTAVIAKTLPREEWGQLSAEQYRALFGALKEIAGDVPREGHTVVLHFFYKPKAPVNGGCIDYYTVDSRYKKQLSKRGIQPIFIVQRGYKFEGSVREDTDDRIRALLFPYDVQCGNYIIVKPDGKFYRRLGEYRQDQVVDNMDKI